MTYIDSDDNWHRASKGAPEQVIRSTCLFVHVYCHRAERIKNKVEYSHTCFIFFVFFVLILKQILTLCNCKEDVKKKAHAVIDKFAERGLRSLAVGRQVCIASLYATY